jgi:hypothetical protein
LSFGDGYRKRLFFQEYRSRFSSRSRIARAVAVDVLYQVTHRGNRRADVFLSDDEREAVARGERVAVSALAQQRGFKARG